MSTAALAPGAEPAPAAGALQPAATAGGNFAVSFGAYATQADADDIARLFVHRDTGEILEKIADVTVGHVAVGIHRDHALDVLGDALPRNSRGIAFALPGHRERVHAHSRAQGDVEFRCAPVSNNDSLQRNVEAGVENPHGM